VKLEIASMPPFDFDLTARIFSNGDAQIRRYEAKKYWQVVRVGYKLVLITVSSGGSVERPCLSVEAKSDMPISDADKESILQTVCSLFNLEVHLDQFYEDVKNDAVMFALAQKLRGLKSPVTASVFEALVDSIIEQQISLDIAHGLERRVVKTFGDVLKTDGRIYYAFPRPESLATASVKRLRECGLSLRKAEYIQNASVLVKKGHLDLEVLKDRPDSDDIIAELDRVRGIWPWTAELTMIRGMRKYDVIPADDLGVRRCVSHYYCRDSKISAEEVRRIADRCGRWKGLASFYLIVAKNLEMESDPPLTV
jgi:DNA-3-methyladenine glycosylase II